MTAVTRIEGHQTQKKLEELFVKWRGFDTTWCTWVFEANLQADVSACSWTCSGPLLRLSPRIRQLLCALQRGLRRSLRHQFSVAVVAVFAACEEGGYLFSMQVWGSAGYLLSIKVWLRCQLLGCSSCVRVCGGSWWLWGRPCC
jgi:hypothetical protein